MLAVGQTLPPGPWLEWLYIAFPVAAKLPHSMVTRSPKGTRQKLCHLLWQSQKSQSIIILTTVAGSPRSRERKEMPLLSKDISLWNIMESDIYRWYQLLENTLFQQADKGNNQSQLTLIITAIGQCEFESESKGGNEPRAVFYHCA